MTLTFPDANNLLFSCCHSKTRFDPPLVNRLNSGKAPHAVINRGLENILPHILTTPSSDPEAMRAISSFLQNL